MLDSVCSWKKNPFADAFSRTGSAYPAPDALSRAVVLSRVDAERDGEHTYVPTEGKDGKKWVDREHWSFLGVSSSQLPVRDNRTQLPARTGSN